MVGRQLPPFTTPPSLSLTNLSEEAPPFAREEGSWWPHAMGCKAVGTEVSSPEP